MSNALRYRTLLVLSILMVGAFGLYALNAASMVLMDPDEARCAAIARNMLSTGEWLVPHLPDVPGPYFDKPILYFWLLAGAFRALGPTEVAARSLSAVAGALVIGATFLLGRQLLSFRAGLCSAIMLATSALMIVAGRFVRMDLWLTAFISWGILFWVRAELGRGARWNLLAGYACLAAAVLTKGLIGVLLPFAAIGTFILLRREFSAIRRAHLLGGLGVMVVLAGPWFAYMAHCFPGYATEFFWRHHFLRASTATFGRSEIVLFLPGVALAGFLPWTAILIHALVAALPLNRKTTVSASAGLVLCYSWAAWGVLPFIISRTQLPVYIMPAFPALALMAGAAADRLMMPDYRHERTYVIAGTLVLMGLSLLALGVINAYTFKQSAVLVAMGRLALFTPLAVLAWRWARDRQHLAWSLLLVMAATMAVDAAFVEGPGMFSHFSSQRYVRAMENSAGEVNLLVIGTCRKHALPYYLKQPVEVQYAEHLVDFAAYMDRSEPTATLMTGQKLIRLAQHQLGPRLHVLDGQGDTCLALIDPAPAVNPVREHKATDKPRVGQALE